jgi:hypothetical protein
MHVPSSCCAPAAAYERCGATARIEGKRHHHGDRAESKATDKPDRIEPRRNPLVAAMMEALKGLTPVDAAPSSTATSSTDANAAPAAATAQAGSLKEAALAFAHALYGALRATGESPNGADFRQSGDARCSHGHGRRSQAWGRDNEDLPHRLEALAQQLVGKPAGAASAALPAGPPTAPATPVPTPLATGTPAAAEIGAAPVAATSPAESVAVAGLRVAPAKTPDAATQENPLVAAFRQLFEALNPETANIDPGASGSSAASTTSAATPSAAQQLAAFLRQLAQSLRSAGGETAAAAPPVGSLINVVA